MPKEAQYISHDLSRTFSVRDRPMKHRLGGELGASAPPPTLLQKCILSK